jgi:hypothetical protein
MATHQYKLGRLRRAYDPRVPHLSALLAGTTPAPLPPSKDWTTGMPTSLGMMLNDTQGDCTCAAFYHALQVWTYNTSTMDTEPDQDVEQLYIQACGYNPAVGGEGPGGNEQHVLRYLMRTGAPTGPSGDTRHKITAYTEVDPRNTDDVKRTILQCGVAYIGFNVPQYILPPPPAEPPAIWDVESANATIAGGHAVVLAGYTDQGARLISWGQFYTMTWAFFAKYVDEVYAITDPDWVASKGTTPGGLSLINLEAQMKALKEG